MEKYIFIAAVLFLILIVYYFYPKQKFSETKPIEIPKKNNPPPEIPKDWNEVIANVSLEPSVVDSHSNYIANTRQFSSGANFSAISDDNTSPIFTNFVGFSRPQFVEIDDTARQIPDIDTSVLKRNKRLTFKNDYNL